MKSLVRGEKFTAKTLMVAAALMFVILFTSACATPVAEQDDADDRLALVSRHVGTVLLIDMGEGIALVQLAPGGHTPAGVLLSRNDSLVETARLEPTRMQSGRILGTWIQSGLPNVGDEVVLSSPDE